LTRINIGLFAFCVPNFSLHNELRVQPPIDRFRQGGILIATVSDSRDSVNHTVMSGDTVGMDLSDLNRHAAAQDRADAFLISNLLRDELPVYADDPAMLGQLWKHVPRGPLSLALKAAVTPIATGDMPTSSPAARAFLDIAERTAILSRAGFVKVDGGAVASLLVGAPTATWLGEGAPKPVRAMTFNGSTLTPRTLNVMTAVSDELAKLSTPGATGIVMRALSAGLTAALDSALIDPASGAVAGVRPASLTNGVSPTTAGSDLQSSVGAAIAAVSGGAAARPVVIVSAQTAVRLTGLRDLAEAGIRVLVSPAAANRIIVVDADGVLYVDSGVELQRSINATMVMDDAPPATDVSTTVHVGMFQRNLTAVKATRFVSWIKRPDAVAFVNLT
jgi:hypothetical protein